MDVPIFLCHVWIKLIQDRSHNISKSKALQANEHVNGFALDFTGDEQKYEKGNQFKGRKLVMTKTGAIFTNVDGNITRMITLIIGMRKIIYII